MAEQYSLYTPNEIWERITKTFPLGTEHPGNNGLNAQYNAIIRDLREAAAYGYYDGLTQKEKQYTYSVFNPGGNFVDFVRTYFTLQGIEYNLFGGKVPGYVDIIVKNPIDLKDLLEKFEERKIGVK